MQFGGIDVAAAVSPPRRLIPNTPLATAAASRRAARRRGSRACSDRARVSNAAACVSTEASLRVVSIGYSSDSCSWPGPSGTGPTVGAPGGGGCQAANSNPVKSRTAAVNPRPNGRIGADRCSLKGGAAPPRQSHRRSRPSQSPSGGSMRGAEPLPPASRDRSGPPTLGSGANSPEVSAASRSVRSGFGSGPRRGCHLSGRRDRTESLVSRDAASSRPV